MKTFLVVLSCIGAYIAVAICFYVFIMNSGVSSGSVLDTAEGDQVFCLFWILTGPIMLVGAIVKLIGKAMDAASEAVNDLRRKKK